MKPILCPGCGEEVINPKTEKLCSTCIEDNVSIPDYTVEEVETNKKKFNLITFQL